MKFLWFTLLLVACAGVNAQSVFIPENGNYKYELKDIAQEFNNQNITYITLDQTRLCTSFFPSKNLGCYGDGGAIFTNDDELAGKVRRICNHGSDKRYYHEVVGVNSRLDALQAAILRIKLKNLNAYDTARNSAAAVYDAAFRNVSGISIPERSPNSTHVFHQYTIKVSGGHRDGLKKHLEDRDIPAMIYYPVPCHLQSAYKSARFPQGSLPVTEKLTDEVLSLPMSTELDNDQLTHITNTVRSYFNNTQ